MSNPGREWSRPGQQPPVASSYTALGNSQPQFDGESSALQQEPGRAYHDRNNGFEYRGGRFRGGGRGRGRRGGGRGFTSFSPRGGRGGRGRRAFVDNMSMHSGGGSASDRGRIMEDVTDTGSIGSTTRDDRHNGGGSSGRIQGRGGRGSRNFETSLFHDDNQSATGSQGGFGRGRGRSFRGRGRDFHDTGRSPRGGGGFRGGFGRSEGRGRRGGGRFHGRGRGRGDFNAGGRYASGNFDSSQASVSNNSATKADTTEQQPTLEQRQQYRRLNSQSIGSEGEIMPGDTYSPNEPGEEVVVAASTAVAHRASAPKPSSSSINSYSSLHRTNDVKNTTYDTYAQNNDAYNRSGDNSYHNREKAVPKTLEFAASRNERSDAGRNTYESGKFASYDRGPRGRENANYDRGSMQSRSRDDNTKSTAWNVSEGTVVFGGSTHSFTPPSALAQANARSTSTAKKEEDTKPKDAPSYESPSLARPTPPYNSFSKFASPEKHGEKPAVASTFTSFVAKADEKRMEKEDVPVKTSELHSDDVRGGWGNTGPVNPARGAEVVARASSWGRQDDAYEPNERHVQPTPMSNTKPAGDTIEAVAASGKYDKVPSTSNDHNKVNQHAHGNRDTGATFPKRDDAVPNTRMRSGDSRSFNEGQELGQVWQQGATSRIDINKKNSLDEPQEGQDASARHEGTGTDTSRFTGFGEHLSNEIERRTSHQWQPPERSASKSPIPPQHHGNIEGRHEVPENVAQYSGRPGSSNLGFRGGRLFERGGRSFERGGRTFGRSFDRGGRFADRGGRFMDRGGRPFDRGGFRGGRFAGRGRGRYNSYTGRFPGRYSPGRGRFGRGGLYNRYENESFDNQEANNSSYNNDHQAMDVDNNQAASPSHEYYSNQDTKYEGYENEYEGNQEEPEAENYHDQDQGNEETLYSEEQHEDTEEQVNEYEHDAMEEDEQNAGIYEDTNKDNDNIDDSNILEETSAALEVQQEVGSVMQDAEHDIPGEPSEPEPEKPEKLEDIEATAQQKISAILEKLSANATAAATSDTAETERPSSSRRRWGKASKQQLKERELADLVATSTAPALVVQETTSSTGSNWASFCDFSSNDERLAPVSPITTPEPAPPSGLAKAMIRLIEIESQMEYAYAKHIKIRKSRKRLHTELSVLQDLPVGLDAIQEDLEIAKTQHAEIEETYA